MIALLLVLMCAILLYIITRKPVDEALHRIAFVIVMLLLIVWLISLLAAFAPFPSALHLR